MSLEIWKARVRENLMPRREPYWGPPLGQGKCLGLRKIRLNHGSWIAKLRDDTGHHSKALGETSHEFDYEKAKKAAEEWFKARDAGVTDATFTVERACREYVEELRREKGDEAAHDAELRFERLVYGTPFGKMLLDKVRTPDCKKWRGGLGLSLASQNREMTSLRAALNLAVQNRRVDAGRALEWKQVRQHKNAGSRRTLFLDVEQRRRLVASTVGSEKDLIEAVVFTGARPGELAKARRSQYDPRTETMTFTGKTGPRQVMLPLAAVPLFNRLAKDKLPKALLFTQADGGPWVKWDWSKLIRAAAEKAGLPAGVCLYVLRHSFITQALTDGMRTLDVARLTGTSLAMIEKHYGHLVAQDARQRMAAVRLL